MGRSLRRGNRALQLELPQLVGSGGIGTANELLLEGSGRIAGLGTSARHEAAVRVQTGGCHSATSFLRESSSALARLGRRRGVCVVVATRLMLIRESFVLIGLGIVRLGNYLASSRDVIAQLFAV